MSEDLAPEASSGFSLWFKDVRLERESAVCGWGLWRHPGMEAQLGWKRLFRTTSHTSLEVTSNSTVSAPGVTLRTFWKHPTLVQRFGTQGGAEGRDHRGLSWKDPSGPSWFKPLMAHMR